MIGKRGEKNDAPDRIGGKRDEEGCINVCQVAVMARRIGRQRYKRYGRLRNNRAKQDRKTWGWYLLIGMGHIAVLVAFWVILQAAWMRMAQENAGRLHVEDLHAPSSTIAFVNPYTLKLPTESFGKWVGHEIKSFRYRGVMEKRVVLEKDEKKTFWEKSSAKSSRPKVLDQSSRTKGGTIRGRSRPKPKPVPTPKKGEAERLVAGNGKKRASGRRGQGTRRPPTRNPPKLCFWGKRGFGKKLAKKGCVGYKGEKGEG